MHAVILPDVLCDIEPIIEWQLRIIELNTITLSSHQRRPHLQEECLVCIVQQQSLTDLCSASMRQAVNMQLNLLRRELCAPSVSVCHVANLITDSYFPVWQAMPSGLSSDTRSWNGD